MVLGFINGDLTLASAGRWRPLRAGAGSGGSGQTPAWCGCVVVSLLCRTAVVGGPFPGGQSSVFQRRLSLLVGGGSLRGGAVAWVRWHGSPLDGAS
jgi:hypothetical protein